MAKSTDNRLLLIFIIDLYPRPAPETRRSRPVSAADPLGIASDHHVAADWTAPAGGFHGFFRFSALF